ncbi:mucin-7-like [Vanessa tameamea]|uniref:Mucin-7-like n=1 Tax=Vanessa tameamea TaxID=334116 RepID=A0A8B8IGZ9_VANTA
MKFILLSSLFVCAMAELPRFRPARFRFQRQELAPTTTDSPTESTTEQMGPYPPSGWRPSGQAFTLPQDTTPTPMDTYGPPEASAPYPPSGWKPQGQAFTLPQEQTPPETSYGAPDTTYGVPENTYGAPSTDSTTTDNPAVEKLEEPVDVQKSVGTYYVLLPNGQLQRVEFVTENDIQNMKYTARLQLRERAPLYVFGP